LLALRIGLKNDLAAILSADLNDTLEAIMLFVEKDDPTEAPESGDKKPQPDKK